MKRQLLLGLALVCLLAGRSVYAVEYVFTNVADSTTAAPIGTLRNFGDPAISGGTVGFRATYEGSAGGGGAGIFIGKGGAVTTIAKFGDAVADGLFQVDFGDPSISGTTVAFRGDYGRGRGIFTGDGGALITIAKSGDPAPEGGFTGFSQPSISDGVVAFGGFYLNNGAGGVFTGSGGPLTAIVDRGDPGPAGTIRGADDPAISGHRIAMKAGHVDGSSGLYVHEDGTLTTIVEIGDAAPTGTFTTFDDPAISPESVAFAATFNGNTQAGIFVSSGGTLTTVVKEGDPAPVGTFSNFLFPSVSGSTVAFVGEYSGGDGLFISRAERITPVIKSGDSLFGSTVSSLRMGKYGLDLNGSGNLTFAYQLTDGPSGIAIAHLVPEPSALALGILAYLSLGVLRNRGYRRGSSGRVEPYTDS